MNCPRIRFSNRTVNLFSIRKRQLKISFLSITSMLFFLYYNSALQFSGNEEDKREIFHSKNLLTDLKNLSETKSLAEEQKLRLQVLETQCEKNRDKLASRQEKVTMLSDPEHKLGYCNIPKIATSSWMIFFAELNDLHLTNNVSNLLFQDNNLHRTVLNEFSYKVGRHNINNAKFHFVFLRHPFERLISAYFDKFVDDPDPLFVKSVIHHEPPDAEHLKWTWQKFEKEKKLKTKLPDFITFPRFVKFILYESEHSKISHGTYHWSPYTNFCALCLIPYNFIGKLETLGSDLEQLKTKFPPKMREKMKTIFAQKKNASHGKFQNTSETYFSQLSKKQIAALYYMYEMDFLTGGYPYPQSYIDLGH